MTKKRFALGIDYGTASVRALIVDVADGSEVATAVAPYPSGVEGVVTDSADPLMARQNPDDYLSALRRSVRQAATEAKKDGFRPEELAGIGVDTTGSTPIPVDEQGTPLSMTPRFDRNPAAMAWLWKDHTSFREAEEITARAAESPDRYLAKCGGTYSSEWFWSKTLHCCRTDPDVADAAATWVELADWIPARLTGNLDPKRIVRSVCAAGHKAMFHPDWGWPSAPFLSALDPRLARYAEKTTLPLSSDQSAGGLSIDAAEALGLLPGTPVAVGGFDAHFGAVGAGIRPGRIVKIIGTSVCDIMVHPLEKRLDDIPGICGIVPNSVLPGTYGLEAGQSAVGDIFNWFVKNYYPAADGIDPHQKLTEEASKLRAGQSRLVALDWNNGNRTILVDPLLSGLIVGTTLHTTPAEIYRTLIEATAFGALTIIKRFEEYGVPVREVMNCGGIAEKNPLLLQIYADVCGRPMMVSGSSQTCALGSAIFGAVAGGVYENVPRAQRKMVPPPKRIVEPNRDEAAVYRRLYEIYRRLHDAFGPRQGSLASVMKELAAL